MKINEKQSALIKRLAKTRCCNYLNGNCLMLDDGENHRCVQIISDSRVMCRYFENVVLPSDKELFNSMKI